MPWYPRVRATINTLLPTLVPTQATNLALLVSALLAQRTCNLTALARAYPRVPATARRGRPLHDHSPKHDLLYRLRRLWRFLDNPRVDAPAIQIAGISACVRQLGNPRWLGLAIDWTSFDTVGVRGVRVRYQVLRIAVPRRGRALPLLQLAYDRDHLPAGHSQNTLEEAALLAVVEALPSRRCRRGCSPSCWPTAALPAPPSSPGCRSTRSPLWSASIARPA